MGSRYIPPFQGLTCVGPAGCINNTFALRGEAAETLEEDVRLPSVVTSLISITKFRTKYKGGKLHLGSQFEHAAHCGWEAMATGT